MPLAVPKFCVEEGTPLAGMGRSCRAMTRDFRTAGLYPRDDKLPTSGPVPASYKDGLAMVLS